eukprot:Opistho-2@42087
MASELCGDGVRGSMEGIENAPSTAAEAVDAVAAAPTDADADAEMEEDVYAETEVTGTDATTTRVKVRPGYASIKSEFLKVLPEKRKADDDGNEAAKRPRVQIADRHSLKKKKMKGLCNSILRGNKCNFAENCRYSHNLDDYLAAKLPDLGPTCINFEKFGKCPYGLQCRFSGAHTDADKNTIVDEAKIAQRKTEKPEVMNVMQKDFLNRLRKRQLDLPRSQEFSNALAERLRLLKIHTDGLEKGKKAAGGAGDAPASQPTTDSVAKTEAAEGEQGAEVGGDVETDVADAVVDATVGVGAKTTTEAEVVPAGVALPSNTPVKDWDAVFTEEMNIRFRPMEKKKIDFSGKLYLAPLTTVGNLPFRRVCKKLGVDITCGEMALATNVLQAQQSEWSLLKRHHTEDIFGVQLCGAFADQMSRCAEVVAKYTDVDFVDINCGCPIDLVYKKGAGSALLERQTRLEQIVKGMNYALGEIPLTIKIRTGVHNNSWNAHKLIPKLRDWGVSLITLHGRSREQRYSKLADWEYINQCSAVANPVPFFGNGDILSYEEAAHHIENAGVSGLMVARGALYKPWIFTEIKERRHWDISSGERLDILRDFVNAGLEHWGSDDQGIAATRRFLLEWLSFAYRYIPVGLLERLPQKINEPAHPYIGRNDLETLMASPSAGDWVKLSEMLLGPVPDDFVFIPKHKANSTTAEG